MSLAAGTRLGRYELLSPLGTGGMGEVYRARDSRLERDVAIKVLPERFAQDPQALSRFQREAKAVASLSHANILAIYDIGSDLGMTYAVMELLEGQTLGTRIRRAPLDWRSAIETALAIADGLSAAHAKGVIHRDIKPDNIFLTTSGGLKILDFGLARLETKASAPTEVFDPATVTPTQTAEVLAATLPVETQPGVLMGTVSYMSPEQARGQPADSRSDIFSFGCVLYEMLSGRAPFLRETSADTMAAILHEAPVPLTQVGRDRPVDLERVINRCLAKKVEERFQSFRDLIPVLKDLLSATDTAKHRIEPAIQE